MEVIETISPREDAGKALSTLLAKNKDKSILLMLSGGSAFTILDSVPSTALGTNITVTMLDERYSTDPEVNNFAQLEQTNFYKTCAEQGVNYISTKVLAGETLDALRNRFDTALHTWKEQNKDGVVIATMGIGADGHTAGIFPGEHGVDFDGDAWVVSYSVPKEVNKYTDRVTVTNTFLKKIVDFVIVYTDRDKKQEIVLKLISNDSSNHLPMNIFRKMKTVRLFTGTPK